MLFLLFSVGDDRYAIASKEIEEVVPYARLKHLPCTHSAFAGLLNFRGEAVPVLDVNLLTETAAVREKLDSRILICKGALANHPDRLLGLLAEQVTEVRKIPVDAFSDAGATPSYSRWLGKVFEDKAGRYIQWIHPAQILPARVVAELVQQTEETR